MKNNIGFGTYRLGEKNNFDEMPDVETVDFAINSGYKVIDVAESYGDGYSEKIVGVSIKKIKRDKVIIITKVSPNNLKYSDVLRSVENSSKLLGTYIDFILIHAPNPKIPFKETFSAMKKLKEKRIIRFYGVSNFSYEQLKEAHKFGISAVQEELNIAYPYNYKQLKFCKENNILFFSYMPLSNGELLNENNIHNLRPYASKYNVPESSIALKWVIQHGTIPIIGSQNKKHILENTKLNFKLDKEEIKELRNKKWVTN